VLRACPAELLWDEANIGETYRILRFRDDAANLADVDLITRRRRGGVKRKIDEGDAILANELLDVVSKDAAKGREHELSQSEDRKDQKASKRIGKTIKRSTRDLDPTLAQPLDTRFVGAEQDEAGVSNRDKLLGALAEPELWSPGQEGQLDNTLRMVLAAGHRQHALDIAEAHAATEAHREVLHGVGLVSADGTFLDTPGPAAEGPRGAVAETVDFMRQTKKGGGHTKVNIFTKRADLKGARLDELQDVTGGSLGGVTFERNDPEHGDSAQNQMDLQADVRRGTLSMSAAHLAIAGIDTPVVKTGAATVLGFRVDATMPSKLNPDQPLKATIVFDKIAASNVVLQLREQMIAIGHLEVGATSIVSSVLRELSADEQTALAAALGADDDAAGARGRVQLTEAIGPSIKKMFEALGEIFADPSTVISNAIEIDGITAQDVTTSSGVHQEEASLSALRTGVDVTSGGADEKTLDLDVALASVAGPLALDTPKLRLSGPEIRVSDLSVKVTLELARNPHGRMAPRRIQLHTVDIASISGDETVLQVPGGLEARFPSVALRDLSAGGIQLPGRGYELSTEEAFGDAHASLGMLEIASQLQRTVGDDLRAGGTLSLSGLAVRSLDAQGLAFSLDDLHVADGVLEGELPGPLAALRALGVDLRHAGIEGLEGEVRQTEDGFRANATLGGVGAHVSGQSEDAEAETSVSATGTRVDLEVGGGATRLHVSLDQIATTARLDAPQLALDGRLALHGIEAEVALVDGAATIVSFRLARIDGAPTHAVLKDKGLELDFPTLAVEDVFAKGITLPGKGDKLDLGSLLADAEAGVGGVTVTGGVKDALAGQLQAGGTLRLDALSVRGLASGGVAFSLAELALVDAHASGGLLAKLGAKDVGVRWAGVSDVAGEVNLGPDGPSGDVTVGSMGADGVTLDGRSQSAMIHDTQLGFDLGKDEQVFTVALGQIATRAHLASPDVGVRGQLNVSDVSADLAVRGEDKSAVIRSLRVGAVRGDGARLDLKAKRLRLDLPTVRISRLEAHGVELPGKGKKLDLTALLQPGGGVSLGRAEIVGGLRSTVDDSLSAGGRFVLDDLSVDGLASGGVAFNLGELAVSDLDVQTSKIGELGRVGVKVGRIGVDDLSGTVTRGEDGVVLEGNLGNAEIHGASGEVGGTRFEANANASGSFVVDDDKVAIEGTTHASVNVESQGALPGAPSQLGGREAKPAMDPRFRWSLPVLDTLGGQVGLVLPLGSKRLPLTGLVTDGALDTAAMCERIAVHAIDYVKARLPSVPEWLEVELVRRAGAAIEQAIRDGARSVGEGLAAQIPRIRPSVEEVLNSPKGPKGAREPLDLSKYIGGLEGVDLQDQVRGALDVVAADAVDWLGAASTTVDFAKDDFGTGAYNSAKSAWYKWVAPVARQITPEAWQDDLRVSQDRIDAHTDWKKVKDEERAKFLSAAMFLLIEGAADWAGDIELNLALNSQGPVSADELNTGQRAIDLAAALEVAGAGTVQRGADLRLNLASHGDVRFGNLDASGWVKVSTGVGGDVEGWQGNGQGNLQVDAGGSVTIRR